MVKLLVTSVKEQWEMILLMNLKNKWQLHNQKINYERFRMGIF